MLILGSGGSGCRVYTRGYKNDRPNEMNPINPTHLHPNLDPGGSTRPEIGFKSGLFIKYIIGLSQNLNSFLGQPDSI